MNLFFKIFLWFLAAIALMVGVVVFLNWTVQTEPVVSRWQTSVRNQMNIYAATAAQIHDAQGEAGLREFLNRLRNEGSSITEINLMNRNGLQSMVERDGYHLVADQAFASGAVELDLTTPDTVRAAKTFRLKDGTEYALFVRWERLAVPRLFGESQLRYLRLIVLFLIALIVCYALARYLSSPIGKIRDATRRLAEGDLQTRVGEEVGGRRDELAKLARDFDLMAERIESLITAQQRLSRDISHELRSPLARMNVALEIAKQKSNDETAPLLERIETESNRLNEMISRLLTLAKLESGSSDFHRSEINLTRLVEQVAADADFEAVAGGKSVVLRQADEARIEGSENLVRSAVENVLRNAVRYTREGTAVEIALSRANGTATVKIQDHGGGVPEDELKNLFRPFYRVGEARERKTGGIGLGLAIADQAIKAHKGSIRATNTGDGLSVEINLIASDSAK
ncbi:MAG: HAMP domain-containing protein [Acidobacteria bacterium]|nr:HAMP domain-containing protein [Acidobacteriota bacterium]